jgi:hypothetical protein
MLPWNKNPSPAKTSRSTIHFTRDVRRTARRGDALRSILSFSSSGFGGVLTDGDIAA